MLKEGSIVKIKELSLRGSYPSGICGEMLKQSNKVVMITKVKARNQYSISSDDDEYTWNKEMFVDGDTPHTNTTIDCLPIKLYSKIFGSIELVNITDDKEYPYDIKLKDGDIISVTNDFKFFTDSESNIL